MIKCRYKDGKLYKPAKEPDLRFIEITDKADKLAVLIQIKAADHISILYPGDMEFASYAKQYKLEVTNFRNV